MKRIVITAVITIITLCAFAFLGAFLGADGDFNRTMGFFRWVMGG